jgi:hypothetical protein
MAVVVPHWIEHALYAIVIGVVAALGVAAVNRTTPHAQLATVYAAAAWVGGVFFHAGREIRDLEKGTVSSIGFDYSGLGAPVAVCTLVFGTAAAVSHRCRRRTGTGKKTELMIL